MRKVLPLLMLCVAGFCVAAEPKISISASPSVVYFGDAFELKIEFAGSSSLSNIDVDFNFSQPVTATQTGRQMNRINNYSSTSLLYTIMPTKIGSCDLQSCTIVSNGKKYELTKNLPNLTVKGADNIDEIKFSVSSDTEEVLIGETFNVTLKIVSNALTYNNANYMRFHSEQVPHISFNFEQPENSIIQPVNLVDVFNAYLKQDKSKIGFTLNNYQQTQSGFFAFQTPAIFYSETQLTNATYISTLTIPFQAKKVGKITFQPAMIRGIFIKSLDNSNPNWERFFVTTESLPISVIMPPTENRPKSFVGIVGTEIKAEATFETFHAKVGDPLMLKLSVTGNFTDESLAVPKLPKAENFRLYDSAISEKIENGRLFTYRVRPLKDGTIEFPEIPISYYDQKERIYKTVKTAAIPLQVKKSTQLVLLGEDGETISSDVLPSGLIFTQNPPTQYFPDLKWFLLPIAGLFVLLFRISAPKALTFLRNYAETKQRSNTCMRALKKIAKAKTPTDITSALRLWLNNDSLTPADLTKILKSSNIPNKDADEILQVFESLEATIYSSADDSIIATSREKLQRLLPKIDKLLKTALLFVFAFSPAFLFARADDDGLSGHFEWKQANAIATQASSIPDYATAGKLYVQMIKNSKIPSEALLVNAAGSLFFAREYSTAERILRRAERLYGVSTESERCMQAVCKVGFNTPSPWTRQVFAWHYRWGVANRMQAFCVAMTLAFLITALFKNRILRFLFWSIALAIAISVAVSFVQENSEASLPYIFAEVKE